MKVYVCECRLSRQDGLQHLPRLFAACMKLMHSGNVAIAKMSAEVMIVRFVLFVDTYQKSLICASWHS